jgi:hypothetical protein
MIYSVETMDEVLFFLFVANVSVECSSLFVTCT